MRQLGPYTLVRRLGQGGMGTVWAARHPRRAELVALKELTHARARTQSWFVAFDDEVRAAAGLDHPHIVRLLDRGRGADGAPYMVMELAGGGSLKERAPEMDWDDVRAALAALLQALAHAHARGITHRDVKPSNLLIQVDAAGQETLQLSDFGIASSARRPRGVRDGWGTPSYMAPEQFRGVGWPQGPWTDLYAVGCMTLALVEGAPPGANLTPDELAVARQIQSPSTLRPRMPIPAGLSDWLAALLAPQPRDRYQSAAAALAGLQSLPPAALGGASAGALLELPTMTATATATAAAVAGRSGPLPPTAPAPASPALAIRAPLPVPPRWKGISPRRLARLVRDNDVAQGLFGLRAVPYVGREVLRDRLWAALAQVIAEHAPVRLALVGDEGVGRSRLAGWLGEQATERGLAVTLHATLSGDTPETSALAEMLARHLGCLGADDETCAAHVRYLLPALHPHDQQDLVAMLCGQIPERRAALGVLTRAVNALTHSHPLVLILDDVDASADGAALAAAVEGPILVLMTTAGAAPEGAEALLVGALPRSEMQMLLRQMLDLSPSLSMQVAELASGNPQLAIQLVGGWISQGALSEGDDGLVLAPDAPRPDTLSRVWSTRLADLLARRPDLAVPLERAALLGSPIQLAEWQAACPDADLPALLGTLAAERLLTGRGDLWRLADGLLREAILQHAEAHGRLLSHRRALAALLEDRAAAPERIGRLWRDAGEPGRAAPSLLRAAADELDRCNYPRSRALLEAHAEAMVAAGAPASDVTWGQSQSIAVKISYLTRDNRDTEPRLETLRADARAHGWPHVGTEAACIHARLLNQNGHPQEALALLDEIETEAQEPYKLRGEWLTARAWILLRLGRADDAIACLEAVAALWRCHDESRMQVMVQSALCIQLSKHGRLDEARAIAEETYDKALAGRYDITAAECANCLGEIARYQGRLEDAVAAYRRALDIYLRKGVYDAALPQANLGLVELALGRPERARPALQGALALFIEHQRTFIATVIRAFLLQCAIHDGDPDEAAGLCDAIDAVLSGSSTADAELHEALQAAAEQARGKQWALARRLQRLADLQQARLARGG